MMLIRTYRVRGHLAADLDPLGLTQRELPADLTPAYHGFADADLDRQDLSRRHARLRAKPRSARSCRCCRPITAALSASNICTSTTWRSAASSRTGWRARTPPSSFTPEGKQAILDKVIHGEQWEKFLARKYVGTKRFGLDGGESAIPALEAVIKYGGQYGVEEIAIGMAHRGRLNVLSNVMGKPYRAIFHEFAGGATNPADVGGSGDVKYHLGTSTDREFDGNKVHLSLLPNPSHLEAVDPVVLGKARAVQTCKGDVEGDTVLPILLHGDAAFAGQGIVAECFGFSGLPGYEHRRRRSISSSTTRSASPPARNSRGRRPIRRTSPRAVQAPILHVNGDDPEAVTFACKLAIEFRQAFNRDIVIDMWCYRRFGHNEGDEPSFTQPLMYEAIRKHPPVSQIYGARLVAEGVIDQAWIDGTTAKFVAASGKRIRSGTSYLPNKADWFEGRWAGLGTPGEPVDARRNVNTAIGEDAIRRPRRSC